MSFSGNSQSVTASSKRIEEPDVMNDPAYNIRSKGKEKDGDDMDTCRICRGEGSQEEPLFYPCKCSGSIKFVHQNCLMEWLAHSQKKHCELCKTPFRFTKLYHPQMPSTVPTPVFLRQAALHGWSSFQTWTRFQTVFFVWVLWLPWCMRTIWRGLFWVGDGAWVDWSNIAEQNITRNHSHMPALSRAGTYSNHDHSLDSREAAVATLINYFGTKATQMINSNPWRKEPISLGVAKRIYRLISGRYPTQDVAHISMTNTTHIVEVVPRSSTWLSDVKFFSTMTRSTTLNNIIIDTLEGQLITLVVVVAFILIFLIREWVMQQQQNMLLGPDAENEAAAGPNIDGAAQQELEQGAFEQNPAGAGPDDNPRPRFFVRPRQRANRPLPHGFGDNAEGQRRPAGVDIAPQQLASFGAQEPSASPSRISQQLLPPKRNANGDIIDPPVELENLLRESTIFQDILQRVRADPSLDILTIIQNEISYSEVDILLQRLTTPEVASYLKAVNFTPTSLDVRILDKKEEIANEPDSDTAQVAEENEDFEFLDRSRPESRVESPWNEKEEVGSSAINDIHQGATSLASINEPRENQEPFSQDAMATENHTSVVETGIQEPHPSSNILHQPSSWKFNDAANEQSPVELYLQDLSEKPSHPNGGDEVDVIGESDMLEKLNTDTETGKEEVSGLEKPLFGSNTENAHDERNNNSNGDEGQEQGYIEALENWLWGDITLPPEPADQAVGDEEHIVGNLAEEEPFVPVAHGQHLLHPLEQDVDQAQDPEVLAAAAQAGIDPNEAEGVDEMEDLEGIMELIGMEGPLAGLLQNGMFCAVLVSLTIFFGVWIPYMSGKIFLTFLASPISLPFQVIRIASRSADVVVDAIVLVAGGLLYWTDVFVNLLCQPLVWVLPVLRPYVNSKVVTQTSAGYAERALDRLLRASLTAGESLPQLIDLPSFSIVAHESLLHIKMLFATVSKTIYDACVSLIKSLLECTSIMQGLKFLSLTIVIQAKAAVSYCIKNSLSLGSAASSMLRMHPLRLNYAGIHRTAPLNLQLAAWDANDRAIAIAAGYTFFAFLGMVYLYAAGILRGTARKDAVNGSLAQVLYQAGGVFKVILIISIEMIIFPLYCGLLLDIALLPLFGNVTLMSRVAFTTTTPWTSMFVHWFVGTCYMFHFALFVSMCRKIMRTGVLYFIRDPDDPTFHPVRDVLERSVSSQLWKISFSALVYGGLVLFCLGGVVWGIAFAFESVFPIHWSSDEPVLEFPVDLLFYNFLMPMAVKIFKPSVGLNKIYGWWFRKCARLLRLSSFLFNDNRLDEQGTHVRRTWTDVFQGAQGDVRNSVIGDDRRALWDDRGARAIFLRDGKYVRAPGSDQVRISKGATTFIEVDEEDHRLDGIKDGEEDPYGRKMNLFMKVYMPPYFGTRIAAFICLIWIFAALTGVGVTIIPLLLGRWIFAQLTPNHLRTNDIYAFSIGIYILGGVAWALFNYRRIIKYAHEHIAPHTTTLASTVQKVKGIALHVLALLYVYSALGILLPCLFSLVLEFYLIIPLQTYLVGNAGSLSGGTMSVENVTISTKAPYPVIHIIQDWTLGVLYIKTFARLILWTEPSRPALALRAIVARGWLSPDIRLATRALILPATLIMAITLTLPLPLGWVANQTLLRYSLTTATLIPMDNKTTDNAINTEATTFSQATVYRYSYPVVLAIVTAAVLFWLLRKLFQGWRKKIRDEVYLIGERLHNFGEGGKVGALSRVRVGKIAVGRAAVAAVVGDE